MGEFLLFVVGFNKLLDNSTRFPKGDPGIWIDNRGDSVKNFHS